MNKRLILVATVVFVAAIGGYRLAASLSADAYSSSSPGRPVWTEATWPFPIDQWGQGWAYQCKAADCGSLVSLYLRPKLGFCNCQTGVSDDAELDRVSDMELVGDDGVSLSPGKPIAVQWMKGRSRGYKVAAPSTKPVLSLAYNDRCDVIVATVVAGDDPLSHEDAVLAFLNGDAMREWAEAVLGR